MATDRLNTILNHLTPSKGGLSAMYADLHLTRLLLITDYSTQQNPDDVVITAAIRTPLAKGFRGGMKDTPLDYIVFQTLREILRRSRVDPNVIEDVCLGNVCRYTARM